MTIRLRANTTRSARTYRFNLTARSAAGRLITKHLSVVEYPRPFGRQKYVAPRITVEPKSQSVAFGNYAIFTARSSGIPTPSVGWQVSTDGGAKWTKIAGENATSLPVAVTPGEAGTFAGDKYRAVFVNVAGSATTSPATLTIPTEHTLEFAGYADYAPSGKSFTSLSADWVVPAIICTIPFYTWAAQWPGIGYGANSLVQDGTIEGCNGRTVEPDAAWYELVGDPAVNGGSQVELPIAEYPVQAGDHIAASVSLAGSTWTLVITDSTQHWVFSINEPQTTPPLNQAAAEVVTESNAPADFGAANFTAVTATRNGQSRALGAFFPVALASYAGSTPLDLPGPFDPTGQNFTDTWEAY